MPAGCPSSAREYTLKRAVRLDAPLLARAAQSGRRAFVTSRAPKVLR
jgi:hypothetical protein